MGFPETKADSHNLMALCRSLRCPHFGSLSSPGTESNLLRLLALFFFKYLARILDNSVSI